ncbi:MAG: recombinase A [Thermodesulfobacteriota bacterium]
MAHIALERADITSAYRLPTAEPASESRWELAALVGRLVEVSGAGPSAALTLAFGVVLDAQRRGEPAAWIAGTESAFFPPDAAEGGVDLACLPVVRVPDAGRALRAADHLVRSGAFSLVVLDLGGGEGVRLPLPALTRLGGLAARHGTALLFLTRKGRGEPSLGSLVSLRAEAVREGLGGQEGGRFACRVRALKDKRRGPGWEGEELCRGPDGLR